MSRWTPRRVAGMVLRIALLGAALTASVLPDHLLNLVCRSGVVMDADGCCPSDRDDQLAAMDQSVWRDEACCSLRPLDLDRAASDVPVQTAPVVHATVSLPAGVPAPRPSERRLAYRSPPPRGPPIAPLLLKSSFLL